MKPETGNDKMGYQIKRSDYATLFGPTTGDKVQLGDTCLIAEVEKDYTVYGDECVFGAGKVIRDGMGQATGIDSTRSLDCVITNALIIDYTGIVKADVGIKNGKIAGIGKAGNPDVMAGVDPDLIIGVNTGVIAGEGLILTAGGVGTHFHYICPTQPYTAAGNGNSTLGGGGPGPAAGVDPDLIIGVNTEVIAGEGLILTAGGVDTHFHYICPTQPYTAVASGITTLVGGGTGPATGSLATTCTPNPTYLKLMMQATDA